MNDFRDYEYIEHYGVKGMHWGIRRYQNKDGSLTPLGKELAKKEKTEEIEKAKKSYDKKSANLEKRINKLQKKIEKNPENKRAKENIDYNKRLKKTIDQISKAEMDAIKNTDWSDLTKLKRSRAAAIGKRVALNTLGMLAFAFGGIGVFQTEGINNNVSKDLQRRNIYNENFAGTKWENGYRLCKEYLERYGV